MLSKTVLGAFVLGSAVVAAAWVWSVSGLGGNKAPQVCPTPAPFDVPWDPPQHVDPEEYRQRYAKYFEAAFQDGQAERVGKDVNVDALHPSAIRTEDGPLGTLFIDNAGKVVLAVKQPLVSNFSEGLALVATGVDPKELHLKDYGFVDRSGRLAIPADYELGMDFREGLAPVKKDGRWGYINKRGEVVIPFRYQHPSWFQEGIARVQPDHDKVQLIDAAGKVLHDSNRWDVGQFSEGLVYVNRPDPTEQSGFARGYVDRDFKFVFRVGEEHSGYWPMRCEPFQEERAAVEIGGKWGFIDRAGKLVVPATFAGASAFSEGLAVVRVRDGVLGSAGYIDRDGKMAIEPRFLSAGPFKEGLAAVLVPLEDEKLDAPAVARPARGKWGYIDRTGKLVVPPRFYQAHAFEHGLASVSANPFHRGYIDKTGAYVWQVTEPTHGALVKQAAAQPQGGAGDAGEKAKIALELHAETPVIKLGEMPRFRAELINQGDKAVVIVLPGDGSDCGWRTPVVRWQRPMGLGGRCGNINALKASEVVTLAPGKRAVITDWLGSPTLTGAGTHKVTLEIENIPAHAWQGLPSGQHDAAAMERVRNSAAFKARSNIVEVRVEE